MQWNKKRSQRRWHYSAGNWYLIFESLRLGRCNVTLIINKAHVLLPLALTIMISHLRDNSQYAEMLCIVSVYIKIEQLSSMLHNKRDAVFATQPQTYTYFMHFYLPSTLDKQYTGSTCDSSPSEWLNMRLQPYNIVWQWLVDGVQSYFALLHVNSLSPKHYSMTVVIIAVSV